jgi:hypothetical protein
MLLTRDILIERLVEHLKKSDQIDVAVAWATDCNALAHLCEFASSGKSLRADMGDLVANRSDLEQFLNEVNDSCGSAVTEPIYVPIREEIAGPREP